MHALYTVITIHCLHYPPSIHKCSHYMTSIIYPLFALSIIYPLLTLYPSFIHCSHYPSSIVCTIHHLSIVHTIHHLSIVDTIVHARLFLSKAMIGVSSPQDYTRLSLMEEDHYWYSILFIFF